MEYSAQWQRESERVDNTAPQPLWVLAGSGNSASQRQQPGNAASTGAGNSDMHPRQAGDSANTSVDYWTYLTEADQQPSAQAGQDLPPLPPEIEQTSDGAEAPPLPEGPPPLPAEPPPPLPAEDAASPVGDLHTSDPQRTAPSDPGEQSWHFSQTSGVPEAANPATEGIYSQGSSSLAASDMPAAGPADSTQRNWQDNHLQVPATHPDQAQYAHYEAPASSEPYAYNSAYDYTYQAQAPWQAGPDAYAATFGQPQPYASQQQYSAYYQQPHHQHWQPAQAAPWQVLTGQYPAAVQFAAPAAYPPPDVPQQPNSAYAAYEAPSVQGGADMYGAAQGYQPAAAAGGPAAGLSGPAHSPIVVVQVSDLFEMPGAARRPKKIAVLLRGIPGSGKTHIAQQLRKMELKVSGDAPRIHCIDDYFMTEVEREEEDPEGGKKGKKRKVQELEYCYEQEMEGSYRRSLLKAYQKTMDEKRFNVVIVDAPNLLVDDFKPYWSAGQSAGYEVYILDPYEGDPETCYKRNIHERSLEDIQGAAACWEPAPPFYPRLDVSSLFGTSPSAPPHPQMQIAEVEMDAAAEGTPKASSGLQRSRWAEDDGEGSTEKPQEQQSKRAKAGKDGHDISQSKPAPDDLPAGLDSLDNPQSGKGKSGPASNASSVKAGSSLSALSKRSGNKSVRWADQVEKADSGFSIGNTAALQLETVYVLSGLGPPLQDSTQPGWKASFAAKARAERSSEHSFKDMMLAKKQR